MRQPSSVVGGVGSDVSTSRGLGNAAYTEESFLKLDCRRVLASNWIAIALVDDAPQPGTVFPTVAAGQPLLVVRDERGDLGVYHNICRHRGTCLVTSAGARAAIVCPYHGWTYALSGALTRTPGFAATEPESGPGVPAEDNGLVPVRFGVWNRLVFVNLDGKGLPLDRRMAALDSRWQHLDFECIRYGVGARHDVRANWKLVTENFLESYHCQPFIAP